MKKLNLASVFLSALFLITACGKQKRYEEYPVPPVPKPGKVVIDPEKLIGWWRPTKFSYPEYGGVIDYGVRYFGRDGLYYVDAGNLSWGVMTGKWSIKGDSVLLEILTGISATGLVGQQVTKLTKDTLTVSNSLYKSGPYLKFDSSAIEISPVIQFMGNGGADYNGDGLPPQETAIGYPSNLCIGLNGEVFVNTFPYTRKLDRTTNKLHVIAKHVSEFKTQDGLSAMDANVAPLTMVVDRMNNLVFCNDSRLRMITADGEVTTIAGKYTKSVGESTGDGGHARDATFQYANGVCRDADFNFYVLDYGRIRKIDAITGEINTIAGNGIPGSSGDGALAKDAMVNPYNITTDAAGNIYFFDRTGYSIRKITKATGKIKTIAGTGATTFNGEGVTARDVNINLISCLLVDAKGNIFYSEYNLGKVRKIDAVTGKVYSIIGSGRQGGANWAQNLQYASTYDLTNPGGLAIDTDGSLLIAARHTRYVLKIRID